MAAPLEAPARALIEGKNFAHVSVLRKDGTIHNVVVWVLLDGTGNVLMNSAEGRDWPAHLRRAGGATISIHNQENPYEFVSITGTLAEDRHEGADADIDALAKKYLGVDSYPYRSDGEQRVTFTLAPMRVAYHGR